MHKACDALLRDASGATPQEHGLVPQQQHPGTLPLALSTASSNHVYTVYIYATIHPRLQALTRLSHLQPGRVFAQSDPARHLVGASDRMNTRPAETSQAGLNLAAACEPTTCTPTIRQEDPLFKHLCQPGISLVHLACLAHTYQNRTLSPVSRTSNNKPCTGHSPNSAGSCQHHCVAVASAQHHHAARLCQHAVYTGCTGDIRGTAMTPSMDS
jgi:hypothetical protein